MLLENWNIKCELPFQVREICLNFEQFNLFGLFQRRWAELGIFTRVYTYAAIEGFLSNNRQLIDQSLRDWYNDAGVLAEFLAGMNVHWDATQWRSFLNQYIQVETEMIASVAAQDYVREIRIFDRMIDLASMMGSYMARGLIAQRPEAEPITDA